MSTQVVANRYFHWRMHIGDVRESPRKLLGTPSFGCISSPFSDCHGVLLVESPRIWIVTAALISLTVRLQALAALDLSRLKRGK